MPSVSETKIQASRTVKVTPLGETYEYMQMGCTIFMSFSPDNGPGKLSKKASQCADRICWLCITLGVRQEKVLPLQPEPLSAHPLLSARTEGGPPPSISAPIRFSLFLEFVTSSLF